MPFIYNDDWFEMVDEEEEYDKIRFAVVRKLFIKLNEKYYKHSNVSFEILKFLKIF